MVRLRAIDTIKDGNCLFAAYAMASGMGPLNQRDQLAAAADLRKKTTNFIMLNHRYEMFVGKEQLGAGFFRYDQAQHMDMERLLTQRPYQHLLQNYEAVKYNAPEEGQSELDARFAYARIMSTPGIWGGVPELYAIAMMTRRDIVLYQGGMPGGVINTGRNARRYTLISWNDNQARSPDPVFLHYNGRTHYTALVKDMGNNAGNATNRRSNSGNNARNMRANNNNNNAQRRRAVNDLMRQQQQQQQQQQYQQNGNGGSGVGSMTTMYVIVGAVSVLLSSIRAAF
jgi:hypothetical protein